MVLRRLRDRGLLEKQGAGSRTYYTLTSPAERLITNPEQAVLPLEDVAIPLRGGVSPYGDSANPHMLAPPSQNELAGISADLQARIRAAGKKPRQNVLRGLVLELCALRAFSAVELCRVLGRSNAGELTRNHLKPMREEGQLNLLYPESEKHPHQAYVAAEGEETSNE
jgi:ATP-dependent DNA helicase RecG